MNTRKTKAGVARKPHVRLNENERAEIKRLYYEEQKSPKDICALFKISQPTFSKLKHNNFTGKSTDPEDDELGAWADSEPEVVNQEARIGESNKTQITSEQALIPPALKKSLGGRLLKIMIKQQGVFKSLKWGCDDHYNAGAFSFENNDFTGRCFVNSVRKHRGGGNSLSEQIKSNGFSFTGDGFRESEDGRVKGYGSGSGFLGYRAFADEDAARNYLMSVGLLPEDCSPQK